ncbi:MAG: GNAT family N-acetyltransferase [Eubacterium sp.]|nr:GNAT family N-acetyltransferase [Eubacterium sp.]
MERKEDELPAEDLIRMQLTLRAVVWDLTDINKEETAKLERELKLFGISRQFIYRDTKEGTGKCVETCAEKYGRICRQLEQAGYAPAEAVVITGQAQLAAYVHSLKQAEPSGMASVYYEKTIIQKNNIAVKNMQDSERPSAEKAGEAKQASAEKAEEGMKESSTAAESVQEAKQASAEKAEEGMKESSTAAESVQEAKQASAEKAEEGMKESSTIAESIRDTGQASADMIVQGFEEIGVQFLDRVLKRRNGLPWTILYTQRTCVREITLSDLDELFELYDGEGITDYTEPLYERQEEEEYTKSYIQYMYHYFGYGMWIIRERKTGKLIGRAGIEHHEGHDGEVLMELGYIIGRQYQNQGYAAEVCRAVIEYAEDELEIDRLYCFIHPENAGSIHVAQKLGFSRIGRYADGREKMICFCKQLNKQMKISE